MAWAFDVSFFGAVIKWTDVVGTLCIIGFTLFSTLWKSFGNT
jgi:hypothetical protein